MNRIQKGLLLLVGITFALFINISQGAEENGSEWTLLVFLNGHNNLDSYGKLNINEMEKVGSTPQVNVIVQWASSEAATTKRLYIKKDDDTEVVNSQVVEDMPRVDMGDYNQLTEFIEWGVKNYPSKRYFVVVWNHGSGWHRQTDGTVTRDISWDDFTGNHITTIQLGEALNKAARTIGHKIDIYGSDACLMQMMEVAQELVQSVSYTVNAEETEPGAGWPYDKFLERLVANPSAPTADVASALTEEYAKSYDNGSHGTADITLSTVNLGKISAVNESIKKLAKEIVELSTNEKSQIASAMNATLGFAYYDYKDLLDFVKQISPAKVIGISGLTLTALENATKDFIVSNHTTGYYTGRATGISIWLPTYKDDYTTYEKRYQELSFAKETGWGSALESLVPYMY